HGRAAFARNLAPLVPNSRTREPAVAARVALVSAGRSTRPARFPLARLIANPLVAFGLAHASGNGGRLLLRLDALAVPELDSRILLRKLSSESPVVGIVFRGRAVCGRAR